ncbi:fibroblast growth factor-binding protein 2-like [Pristis pectinata]|uniref:fibroblast growth factor-binding protein 2-like n=1 Tax=Pristis pectinata TaxID=685728 RepID=UPI00223D928C|nr:fibroblast growth factor-binding protein 2-like [Pristis pectinata]XP_051883568.1 fibroblast growth factor-binding protein 2-like [Pristis pectinata]
MKLLCVPFLFLFLLCLTFSPGEGAKSGDSNEQLNRPSKKRKGKSLPTGGALTTKDNHACSWNVTGEGELTLQISCSYQGGSYWCNYTGRPQSCPTYNTKAAQYWKQAIGKVKRKKHACEGDKTLKTRICKKAPTESQMKLKGKSWNPSKREDKVYSKSAGRKKALGKVPAEKALALVRVNSTETLFEKKRGKSKASESTKSDGQSALGEMSDDDPEFQEELSHTYCAEKWHSLCSFFVNLWNG